VAKLGIAFEYGKDKDNKTYLGTINGIKKILRYFGMTHLTKIKKKAKTDFFEVFKSIAKPEGFIVSKKIRNFKLVKKGELIGSNLKTGSKILANSDFYPILFGKNTYKDIFGFAAKKINPNTKLAIF
jgi:hypothetical protein